MRFRSFAATLALVLTACVIDLPDRQIGDGAPGDVVTRDTDGATTPCGNGSVDPGERCDTAISADTAGGCPTACDDGLSCTADALEQGGTCQASCTFSPITACADGDGCCPTGCTPQTDDDCSPDCGNGTIDLKETCDTAIPAGQPGACPTACDDNNSCTTDQLLSAGTCSAQCSSVPVTTCANGDGCCPQGCDSGNDDDCSPSCGNGVLDSGEKCDTAIAAGQAGACPATCSDGKACTTDALLSAGTCNAQCSFTAITQCKGGDNCCPSGCNNNTDSDCSATCGNGAVESTEKCDTAIAAGQSGACPTSCNDNKPCTQDSLLNPGTCDAQCNFSTIQQCKDNDGCCPSGCNNNNDSDCSASCGNGAVESGEKCDTAIPAGQSGACPTSCNDNNACTNDSLVGGGCSAECSNTAINSCTNNDGCCPTGCNANIDNDCTPVCGNGATETGETCDPPSTCPTSCTQQACKTVTLTGSASKCTAKCNVSNVSNGSSCTGGKCYGGSCCTGCWDGLNCKNGSTTSACGSGGGACSTCTPSSTCETASCTNGGCTYKTVTNGTSCQAGGASGKCYSGSCCTGCWDGNSCQTPTASACGSGGGSCVACAGATCQTAICSNGSCALKPAFDGTSCTNGKCYSGKCCTGCWNGSLCLKGFDVTGCGRGGVLCQVCSSKQCCDTTKFICVLNTGGYNCLL